MSDKPVEPFFKILSCIEGASKIAYINELNAVAMKYMMNNNNVMCSIIKDDDQKHEKYIRDEYIKIKNKNIDKYTTLIKRSVIGMIDLCKEFEEVLDCIHTYYEKWRDANPKSSEFIKDFCVYEDFIPYMIVIHENTMRIGSIINEPLPFNIVAQGDSELLLERDDHQNIINFGMFFIFSFPNHSDYTYPIIINRNEIPSNMLKKVMNHYSD